jgi:hypothetical protein
LFGKKQLAQVKGVPVLLLFRSLACNGYKQYSEALRLILILLFAKNLPR